MDMAVCWLLVNVGCLLTLAAVGLAYFGSCVGHRNSESKNLIGQREKYYLLYTLKNLKKILSFEKDTHHDKAFDTFCHHFCSLDILIQTCEMRHLILKPETALKNLHEDKSALMSSSFLHFYIKRLLTICPLVAAYKTAIMDVTMSESDNWGIKSRFLFERRC
uniref:Uncharacterized protein n=1 Tax=Glossina pallidipes TaxID=7398 RepID=A0A1B0AJ59_GLOPL